MAYVSYVMLCLKPFKHIIFAASYVRLSILVLADGFSNFLSFLFLNSLFIESNI